MRRRTIGASRLRTARPRICSKFGMPALIEHTDFAVDDKTAAHFLQRLDNFRIPSRRVFLVARDELVFARQHAIAVVFELEYPASSLERRMIRGQHQVNGAEIHASWACSPRTLR